MVTINNAVTYLYNWKKKEKNEYKSWRQEKLIFLGFYVSYNISILFFFLNFIQYLKCRQDSLTKEYFLTNLWDVGKERGGCHRHRNVLSCGFSAPVKTRQLFLGLGPDGKSWHSVCYLPELHDQGSFIFLSRYSTRPNVST